MWWTVSIILFLVVFCLIYDAKKPYGFPPGPSWLPLVGNILEFLKLLKELKYTHLVWSYWGKRYGPLAGIRLGLDKIVIINDYKFAREVLLRDEFEGRPDGFLIRMRSFGKKLGVVFTDGDFGQEQRAFCIRNLKEFGFGRSLMEDIISEEISELIQSLNGKCQEGPVDVYSLLNINVMNTLWTMIAGTRFSHRDEKMLTLLEYIHTSFRMQDMTGGILNQLPIIRFIGPGKRIYEHNLEIANNLIDFMRETVEDHKKTISPNYTRDLVDAFLQEIGKGNKSTENNFSEEQLLITLMDLFMAGADTTINTITFVIQMLIKHPDVQKKAQQELDLVVGDNTQATLKDRNRLNYLEAVIMEVQRFCNATPTSIPHRAKKCVKLHDCIIPKDTSLVVNLYSIHMSKEHWGDPEVFRPERFLDSNGVVKHDEWLMPFGLGRRRCLGEILARASVFKYSSALLLNFNITSPKGIDFEIEPHDGAILFPQKFPITLTPRKK